MAAARYWLCGLGDVRDLGGSGGPNGIMQVNQFQLVKDGIVVNSGSATVIDGPADDGGEWNTGSGEGSEKLLAISDSNKALYLFGPGSPKFAWAIFDFGADVDADAANFITGNDAQERDPTAAKLLTGPSISGPWTSVLDVSGLTITTDREATTQDFPFDEGGGDPEGQPTMRRWGGVPGMGGGGFKVGRSW